MLGNAAAVGISNTYYADNRTPGANVTKLGEQIGIDAASQVLKEFWPDIKRRFFQHKSEALHSFIAPSWLQILNLAW